MKKILLPLLLLAVGTSQNLSAEIYKWTDKDGKVHYSSTPPKENPQSAQVIGDKIKANIGKVQPVTSYKANTTEKEEVKKTTKKADNPYENDRSAARVKYCENLKKNINTLENNKNINIIVEGNPTPISDTDKEERIAKYKADLEKNCENI
ncbi:DUF4124 domain-containing protein [Leucothrix sargassi]|nr:DUF4124 domain-containing protein [Leucothrix sargassi]